ncbi:hypothetical protein [Agrococcus sp. Ld7]|uniref:hypothetical protein n=1 Tax=Agrococcus sp. Ld7 TaxID=649148 RepID=UPI00386D1BF3
MQGDDGAGERSIQLHRAREIVAASPGAQPERDASLVQVRHGVYADSTAFENLDRDARYLARIRAVHAVRSQPIFARESALAVHGVPFGLEPDAVYTTGNLRTARRKGGVVHVPVELHPADIAVVGDLAACSLAFALADVARRRGALDAVSALDWALRRGSVTKEEVLAALDRQGKRGRARAAAVIAFSDAASESVGESWSRVRVFQLGFAMPELQVWVARRSGQRYRVDMRWCVEGRRPVYGEFDGMQKYGELAHLAGKTGAQALAKEKARDDDLLFSGDPAHWVWADVQQPSRLARMLSADGVPRVRAPMRGLSRDS